MLQQHYFPAEQSRCFRYGAAAGGWPDALLAPKQVWSVNNNTIVVPNDENWIIQGALGPDGVPVKLDARLSSGSAIDYSEASIVVRHVRFSVQRAPLDIHVAARTYNQAFLHNPYFGNDETRLGGAFSYDGGGLNPEVLTPKLVFEHVVFDRNQAVTAAAIFIAGRTDTISSIKLVVDGSLFFRNAAVYAAAAIWVLNTMPSVLLVNNSEFLHNSAFVPIPVCFAGGDLDKKVGVQGRRNTYTVANSHFDGDGGWVYAAGGPMIGTHSSETADGTIHEGLFERVTVVDVKADSQPSAISCTGNGLRETHCVIRECHVARVVGVEGSQMASVWHASAVWSSSATTSEISRLTLAASGSFVDGSRGAGALQFTDSSSLTGYRLNTEHRVVDSTFVHNQAASGGAIAILCVEIQVAVWRSFFEVGALQHRL
jgi:hypothetical protein